MKIEQITQNKKSYLDLLLLGDESEQMINHYLERGDMYILQLKGMAKGVCVVTDEGNRVLEIKNIAIDPSHQRMGYGRQFIEFIKERYNKSHCSIIVGTGETHATLNFYTQCGFTLSHRIDNFFIENYDHPIIEEGVTLKDMVYLSMEMTNTESLKAWEENAEFWDNYMGDESNFFHCDLVRPHTEELLGAHAGELILDIACGNGNFSERLASRGVRVVAVDYSPKMIELARKRRVKFAEHIEFAVCDVTVAEQLMTVSAGRTFDKAVANMALMDISDIKPLFRTLEKVLKPNGIFVFSMHHPCFTAPSSDYFTPQTHKGVAVEGQPLEQNYYHRSLQDVFNLAFKHGFCVDGFYEVPFEGETVPIIIIVRVRKVNT